MKSAHIPGIFNDVIGPVMRGPSSSHTAAAHRIGSIIRQAGSLNSAKVTVKFDKTSSLATTYKGQGSSLGLTGGLLGIEMTDPEIIDYEKHLGNSTLTIEYIITEIENKHPNAYQINVKYPDGEELGILAISTGGGMIEIVEWDRFKISVKGDFFESLLILRDIDKQSISDITRSLDENRADLKYCISYDPDNELLINIKSGKKIGKESEALPFPEGSIKKRYDLVPVMPVPSLTETDLPFSTVDEMLELASDKNLSLSDLALLYESARTGLSHESIMNKMEEIVTIINNSIDEGLKGTHYEDRILGTQSKLIAVAEEAGIIKKTINSTIIAYTSAIMEVKSSMGVIVAAPTTGSCGVLGGALFGSLEEREFNSGKMTRAFLAAGITGVFIAKEYTFSAEEGGCQVETGSASAMAAAGLVEMNGGNAKQAVDAASMALQNSLGLICDPVAVRVEVPCLGKNIMAATNALNSCIMALAGYDKVIPYNEAIDSMKSVGESLPSSLCCTGLGGLAQTPTGKCLYKKYNKQ